MRTHRFTATTFFIWGGLLIYGLSFLVMYVFAALACARQFAASDVFGVAIVPFGTSAWSVVAAGAIAALMVIAQRRNRSDASADEHTRFIRFLAIGASGLSLVALVWLTLPVLVLRHQCG